ncbi:putative RNA-binding protein [Habropoda laboriosa]|uniref:Putative RNA-binding protein n=1 Tax=Habropoda laboriosa TaxID=597456 RepID=A0A0L7QW95_9HYME|nr:putative RNA-binding protein [Habropoda laboriosa]
MPNALKYENSEEMEASKISEKKRLESVKLKKEIFRAKELAVQNALRNLDSIPSNNKIIFDDDINKIKQPKTKEKKKNKRDLFYDEDDDDDGPVWDDSKFKIKDVTGKYFGHKLALGNDERFKLDMRFIEDDHKSNENITRENDNNTSLQREKELQLDILENILGAPIASKNRSTNIDLKYAKKRMIRYDPTENNHKEYEIDMKKSEVDIKKVQKKKKIQDKVEDTIENSPVEVSKDVYFSVSDTLSKTLKGGEHFSLLKTYGKAEEGNDNYNRSYTQPLEPPKFQFSLNSKNPFKYDSSDDECNNKYEYVDKEQYINDEMQDTNKFFFYNNDVRFNGTYFVKYAHNEITGSSHFFKNLHV